MYLNNKFSVFSKLVFCDCTTSRPYNLKMFKWLLLLKTRESLKLLDFMETSPVIKLYFCLILACNLFFPYRVSFL